MNAWIDESRPMTVIVVGAATRLRVTHMSPNQDESKVVEVDRSCTHIIFLPEVEIIEISVESEPEPISECLVARPWPRHQRPVLGFWYQGVFRLLSGWGKLWPQ